MTHIYLGKPSDNIEQWIKKHHGPKLDEPLCFTAVDADATIAFNKNGKPDAASIVTSRDKQTWTPYTFNTVITLANVGDKVYFRAEDENDISFYKSFGSYGFATTAGKKIAASGNIQTLMKADGSKLDISGKTNCYAGLFSGCTSLTTAPVLPATTLADSCYASMFYNCSSLTTAPELPATTLTESCYSGMFVNCWSLTTVPTILPATTLASRCYNNMFYGCSSLTTTPSLPATTLAAQCYFEMFGDCTSLTTAPELPATTLADYCYYSMFNGCIKLTSINVNFTAWSPTNATSNWVKNAGIQATGTKTFTCPAALPKTTGDNYIPSGWTIVEK